MKFKDKKCCRYELNPGSSNDADDVGTRVERTMRDSSAALTAAELPRYGSRMNGSRMTLEYVKSKRGLIFPPFSLAACVHIS